MEHRRAGYAIVFVVLLCALATWNSEEKRRRAQNMAWNHCRKELADRKKTTEDEDATDDCKSILLKKNVLKAFESLHPQMKKMILYCLSKNREKSTNLCLEFVFDSPNTPRRHLSSNSDNQKQNLPMSVHPVNVNPFSVPTGFKLPPTSPSVTVEHAQNKSGSDSTQTVLIAAAAAVGVIILVAVILFCCIISRRGEENGSPVSGRRDERSSVAQSQSIASFSEQASSLGHSSHIESSLHDEMILPTANNQFGSNVRRSSVSVSPLPGSNLSPGKHATAPVVTPPEAPPPPPPPVPPSGPAAPPPPRPPGNAPPPPPPGNAPPPPPPKGGRAPPPPRKPGQQGAGAGGSDNGGNKAKLKPFFWDKVAANPNRSMVWNEISDGSFQFNEEEMESLFGCNNATQNKPQKKEQVEPSVQCIQLIDKKKAQNLSILLKALNVTTRDVCDALTEGHELPVELITTLLKMAPTQEEELKLKSYFGDVARLGPAERFLKSLLNIPSAYRRLECLLFISSLQEETGGMKEAFVTLEVASNKLKKSRLFLKLLEAVLKTGNRMNVGTYRGGAMAFKLDTLLKLSDVKGTDGKTTLLHFVVQEIIRFEGRRAARQSGASAKPEGVDMTEHYCKLGLEVVSGLSAELEDVKKASIIDADSLTSTLSRLGQSLVKSKQFMKSAAENTGESESENDEFFRTLTGFMEPAEGEIMQLLEEEKRIMALVKSTGDYFHGSSGKDEGLRLFVIVRDFLKMLDKVCNQITEQQKAAAAKNQKKDASTATKMQQQASDKRHSLFPQMRDRQTDDESSSDESKDSDNDKDA